jgi:hypothetical protein
MAEVTETTSETTGWTDGSCSPAVVMLIAGTLNAIYGLVSVNDEWVVWGNRGRSTSTSPHGLGAPDPRLVVIAAASAS